VVAGVVEEASFRGYMQSPIERRHGPVAAILITGILFGVAHFTHPGVGLILMPYYVTVAAIYGSVAYLTNSIFPGMVLHAGGDVLSGSDLLLRGHSEWQSSSGPSASIWQTGIDAPFLVSFAVTVVVGAAAVWAYHSLAAMTRHNRERRFTGAGKVNSIGSDAPF
jgi:hypothetical protein